MKLLIVIASVRDTRIGDSVGRWATKMARTHGGFDEVETVDLKEINLPVFHEPNHPLTQQYVYEYTKKWATIVDSADAFLFVTPEYDYFAPSSLVNAVQYLLREWSYKAVGIVSYGGISGGLRSAQAIKPLLTSVRLMPIPEGVMFMMASESIDNEGDLLANNHHETSASTMLDELLRWSSALAPLRG